MGQDQSYRGTRPGINFEKKIWPHLKGGLSNPPIHPHVSLGGGSGAHIDMCITKWAQVEYDTPVLFSYRREG